MGMKIRQMKTFITVALCMLVGCSKPSSETAVQDTVTEVVAVDSSSKTVETIESAELETPIVISDSAANALNTSVSSEFEKIYLDTTNCYKVVWIDYYDEWEGQWELKQSTWYFTKDFSIIYGTNSYENGAMERPTEIEFVVSDNQVTYTKEIYYTGSSGDKSLTRWDAKNGGVILNWSDYFEKIESVESVPVDYGKNVQNTWDSNLSTLLNTVENEDLSGDEEVYSVLKEVPKPAELTDYTKLIIPKAVYNKLKAQ